jgi:hypothetical protein
MSDTPWTTIVFFVERIEMKILVVGMADSIHLAKWLSQFKHSDLRFRVVSSSPHRFVHPMLLELLETPKFSMGWLSRRFSFFFWICDRFLSDRIRGLVIAKEIKTFNPDLVHVMEFQNGGYAYLRARNLSETIPKYKLLLTPYGSDIFWFQNYPAHLAKIKNLLSVADGLSSECRRDELLAQKYGFEGMFMPRIPAFGSFDLSRPETDRSQRNIIAVKGYQNKWGQAVNAIKAIERVAPYLENLSVAIYSAEGGAISAARRLHQRTGIEVKVHRKHSLTNQEILELFSRSQIYIGLSKSDGISASMIEAMSQGAIPIQSNTSCCGEWLDDEIGGYLVKYDEIELISQKILRVIRNEEFQIQAATHNYYSLKSKLDSGAGQKAAFDTYRLLVPAGHN